MRFCLSIVCALAVAGAAVASTTVNLPIDGLAGTGWKVTTATVSYNGNSVPLNSTVTEATDYGAGAYRFYTGAMNTSWDFQWAGLSTSQFNGQPLSSITSLKIRNLAAFGDNAIAYQPPVFTFVVNKGDGNQRCITWTPWGSGNRETLGLNLKWNEFDAATMGTWTVYETGAKYSSLQALKNSLPSATFEVSANLPSSYGYLSHNAFNVGNCPLYDEDRAYFTDTAGYVDWFEVGYNGNVTRYNLPEPASLVLLVAGLGLVTRRTRK